MSITRNVLSNWAGFAVQVVTTFFLTPIILSSLGPAAYGVWALAVGMTGYYGLLDLGVRAGLTQFIARHLTTRDYRRMNQTASTGFFLLAALSLVLFLVGLLLAALAPTFLRLPQGPIQRQAQIAIAVLGFGVASQFSFFTFSAVLTATERFDLANAVGIALRITTAVAIYVLLRAHGGLVGLSVITAAGSIADYGVRTLLAYRVLPELKIRLRDVGLASGREFLGFGVWNVAIAGGVRLISYTDALVIATFLPVAAITPFAVAASLSSYFAEIVASGNVVFFPRFTSLDAKNDLEGMRRLYLQGSAVFALFAVAGGIGAYVWAGDFLSLWLGAPVLDANPYGSAVVLFRILLIGTIVTGSTRIGYQLFMGTRRVKTLAVLMVGEGLANLLLSVVLVRKTGLLGVAIGTMVPAVLFNGVIHPAIALRQLRIRLRRYLTAVYPKVLLSSTCVALTLWSIRLVRPATNWASFVVQVALGISVSSTVVAVLWRAALIESGLLPASLVWLISRPVDRRAAATLWAPKSEPNAGD